jgi:Cu-processing system ATP-binding protein
MPQQAHFPGNLTGNEILALLSDLRSQPATDVELIRALGLDRDMARPIRTLSGGTRQKLNAAMAFLFQPRLLILDEPTAGLDPSASAILKQKIRRVRDAGASVVLTSHILADLETLVDDVVFLLEGRIVFKGSLHQLKESTGQDRLEPAVVRLMGGRK